MAIKDKMSPLANRLKEIIISKIWAAIGVVVLLFLILGLFLTKHNQAKAHQLEAQQIEKAAKFTNITANFSEEDTQNALSTEQSSLDDLDKKVSSLEELVNKQAAQLDNQEKEVQQQQNAQAKTLVDLRTSMGGQMGADKVTHSITGHLTSQEAQSNLNAFNSETLPAGSVPIHPQLSGGMQQFNLNFNDNESQNKEDNYVPAGTFAKAVLLGGADANASVNGQSNTSPILFRILAKGTEPNGKKAPLTDCFVVAETYGDISSERGEVRLNRLSCNKPDGTVLDIPIKGTAYDIGGKEGIRGIPVMRNGKIIFYAGTSGFLSGMANSLQNAETTQSISPLGSTTTVSPSDSLKYGALGGGSTAMDRLSQYYIKRADQYHPIIELNPGALADIVFLEGFSLQSKISQTATAPQTSASQQTIQQVLTQASNANATDAADNNGETI